jgi:glycolate oxidase
MPFSKRFYKKIQKIVGPENVSKDPAVLDSYACHATFLGVPTQGMYRGVWWNRASAIVLPGSVEEIQEIVKSCNKYKVRFKAHSTGQYPGAFPQDRDGITIDLCRLNKIIEINKEHMYTVVEPYVTQAEIFTECIKHGLAPHMIDAGASISPLASITSVGGSGDSSITRGYNERNGLALEWILPTGEKLTLGSPNTPNAGWFSGDGPGPSLYGVIRGEGGAFGTRGIFTKVAIKLYPWHGPKKISAGGRPPWFDLKDGPYNKILMIIWNNYDRECDGIYLIGEAEILDSFGRCSTTKQEALVSISKNEWARMRRANFFGKMLEKGGWFGHIVAINQAHYDYCVNTLKEIAKKTGAKVIDPWPDHNPLKIGDTSGVVKNFEEYIPKEFCTPEFLRGHYQGLFQMIVLKNFTLKACEMPMAGTNGPLPAGVYLSPDKLYDFVRKVHFPAKKKWQKKGYMLDDGPDGSWCTIDEGGHMMQYMNFTRMEVMDPDSNAEGLTLETLQKAKKWGLPRLAAIPPVDKLPTLMKYIDSLEDDLDPNATRDPHFLDFVENIYKEFDTEED